MYNWQNIVLKTFYKHICYTEWYKNVAQLSDSKSCPKIPWKRQFFFSHWKTTFCEF